MGFGGPEFAKDKAKLSKECKLEIGREIPAVDQEGFNDDGDCVTEGNVLQQIKVLCFSFSMLMLFYAVLCHVMSSHIMLCYVMLCMLCYVMLCYVMLCMLCYVMLCYVMLCYVMLCMLCYVCYVMLCYVMLCYVMLCMLCYVCYVMLCYVMLCYVMLCYMRNFVTILIILFCFRCFQRIKDHKTLHLR